MAVTEYIGPLVGPVFADPAEWTPSRSYEALNVVLNEGNSYTARQDVPIGIDISNEKFWLETGNYNAQLEYYRKEVFEHKTSIDNISSLISSGLIRNLETFETLDDAITWSVSNGFVYINQYESDNTLTLPANSHVIVNNIKYNGEGYAVTITEGFNGCIVVNNISAPYGGGVTFKPQKGIVQTTAITRADFIFGDINCKTNALYFNNEYGILIIRIKTQVLTCSYGLNIFLNKNSAFIGDIYFDIFRIQASEWACKLDVSNATSNNTVNISRLMFPFTSFEGSSNGMWIKLPNDSVEDTYVKPLEGIWANLRLEELRGTSLKIEGNQHNIRCNSYIKADVIKYSSIDVSNFIFANYITWFELTGNIVKSPDAFNHYGNRMRIYGNRVMIHCDDMFCNLTKNYDWTKEENNLYTIVDVPANLTGRTEIVIPPYLDFDNEFIIMWDSRSTEGDSIAIINRNGEQVYYIEDIRTAGSVTIKPCTLDSQDSLWGLVNKEHVIQLHHW